jgi:hypothetical protein
LSIYLRVVTEPKVEWIEGVAISVAIAIVVIVWMTQPPPKGVTVYKVEQEEASPRLQGG